jgi:hypothetical protein
MRYILGFLATIGLIILILILLLRGGGDSASAPKALNLADYARSDSAAHLVIDGPVVADQNHQQVKIDVDANEVSFTLQNGYDGDVVIQQTYPNNQNAYTNFLLALQHQGFTTGNTDPTMKDERGYCPLGQRKIYSFTDGSDQLMRYWSTGCNVKTFKGNSDAVTTLFRRQVPDYSKFISQSKLNLYNF